MAQITPAIDSPNQREPRQIGPSSEGPFFFVLAGRDLNGGAFDDLVDGEELFEDSFEVVQVEGVGSVGFGVRRVVVDLKEDSVDSGGYGGAGEDGDELGLAA